MSKSIEESSIEYVYLSIRLKIVIKNILPFFKAKQSKA